jgi:hypothetical protein
MNRSIHAALFAVIASACLPSLRAQSEPSQQPPAAGSPRIGACSLVSREEVKKHLPWIPALDRMAVEEEPVGTSGSSCNYPSVFIQFRPFSQRVIDLARKKGGLETIRGVGDEAHFHNNANRYAELYVRAGKHLLTLQANAGDKIESVKPGVLNLAKALVAKLR